MKEINREAKDEVVIVGEKEVEKKKDLLYSYLPHKGHKLYELTLSTGTVLEATFSEDLLFLEEGQPLRKRKYINKEGVLTTWALNKKNAVRHFTNHLRSLPPVNK